MTLKSLPILRLALVLPVIGLLQIMGCSTENVTDDPAENTLRFERAYMVQPAGNAPSVLYMTISNGTDAADTLIDISSSISDDIELHEDVVHEAADGEMPVEMVHMMKRETLEVPADEKVHLSPGGFHIMIMNPNRQIIAGDSIDVTLTFANSGAISGKAAVITYSDVDTAVTRRR